MDKYGSQRIVSEKKDYEDLICPICTQLMKPCIQFPCCHEFCSTCVDQLISQSINKCPLCREVFQNMHEMADNRNFKAERKVDQIRVACIYKDFGCTKDFKINEIEIHEENCEFRKLSELIEEEKLLSDRLKVIQEQIKSILSHVEF